MKRYKKITVLLFLAVGCGLAATAQEAWDVDRCMSYAVKHNRTVKQRRLEADNYRLDRLKAIGSFYRASVRAQACSITSVGRSIRKPIYIIMCRLSTTVTLPKPQ